MVTQAGPDTALKSPSQSSRVIARVDALPRNSAPVTLSVPMSEPNVGSDGSTPLCGGTIVGDKP